MFQTKIEAPLRGAGTPDKPFGFYDATVDGGWQVPGEPYTSASDDPARQFWWWRARMLGGRTNHWGRISLRIGPVRLQAASARRAGLRLADRLRGPRAVLRQGRDARSASTATNEGLENTPDSLARRAAAAAEAARRRAADRRSTRKKLGIPVIADPSRRADAAAGSPRRLPTKLHPGNAQAQRILAERMRSARGVLLGDAVRPRLLDQGELPVDDRASAAGAGDAAISTSSPTRWCAK